MKFITIYQRIIPLWPSQILISDGYEVEPSNEATPGTNPAGGKKFFFPTLDIAWCEAEDKVDPKIDTWGDMMIWSMFQEFHSAARIRFIAGELHLNPADISLPAIEKRFRENLNTEGWEIERDSYEGF